MYHISSHYLVAEKLSVIKNLPSSSRIAKEARKSLAVLLTYEATSELRPKKTITNFLRRETETFLERGFIVITPPSLPDSMLRGILEFIPKAQVGRISTITKKGGHQSYFLQLGKEEIEKRIVLVVIPYIDSESENELVSVLNVLRDNKCREDKIKVIAFMAYDNSLKAITKEFPGIDIYLGDVCRYPKLGNDFALI